MFGASLRFKLFSGLSITTCRASDVSLCLFVSTAINSIFYRSPLPDLVGISDSCVLKQHPSHFHLFLVLRLANYIKKHSDYNSPF